MLGFAYIKPIEKDHLFIIIIVGPKEYFSYLINFLKNTSMKNKGSTTKVEILKVIELIC